MLTLKGARYGRGRSGSLIRSLITASCAAVKREEHAEREQAREEGHVVTEERRCDHDRRRDERGRADRERRHVCAAAEAARSCAGSCPCSPREYASREKPEIEVVTAARRISAPVIPTYTRSPSPRTDGSWWPMLVATPISGARIQREPSSVSGPGNAESATTAIATYIVTTVAIPPNTTEGGRPPAVAPLRRGSPPSRGR